MSFAVFNAVNSRIAGYSQYAHFKNATRCNQMHRILNCIGYMGQPMVNLWLTSIITSGSDVVEPIHIFNQHQAAVRALAWCPWQSNLLATGYNLFEEKNKTKNENFNEIFSCEK